MFPELVQSSQQPADSVDVFDPEYNRLMSRFDEAKNILGLNNLSNFTEYPETFDRELMTLIDAVQLG